MKSAKPASTLPTWAVWTTVILAALLWTHGLLLILEWLDVM